MIRLEQNYRSTQNILTAANEVICHNEGRKKKLWTANGDGDKVRFRQFLNGFEEAEYVAGMISRKVGAGKWRYGDCAVLYRTNAQSRMFEEKFLLQMSRTKSLAVLISMGEKRSRMYWPT